MKPRTINCTSFRNLAVLDIYKSVYGQKTMLGAKYLRETRGNSCAKQFKAQNERNDGSLLLCWGVHSNHSCPCSAVQFCFRVLFLKQENLIMAFTSLIMVNTFILLVPPHLKLLSTLMFFCIILHPLVCLLCVHTCVPGHNRHNDNMYSYFTTLCLTSLIYVCAYLSDFNKSRNLWKLCMTGFYKKRERKTF